MPGLLSTHVLGWNHLPGLFGPAPIMTSGTPGTPRNRRAGVLRRWFDERTFSSTPTPFAIDLMLLVGALLGGVGLGVGWLAAVVAGSPQPSEVGALAAFVLLVAYWLAVKLGTSVFWLYDRRARAARLRDSSARFEKDWADSAAAAFRALGRERAEDPPPEPRQGIGENLWHLVDDRPRAVIMEAFARLERRFTTTANPPPTAATRAFASLHQLRQLAVLHEFDIPPRHAREFLHLCALTAGFLGATDRG